MTDTTLTAWTAEGIAYTIEPAGLFVRVCACAIDMMIQGSVILTAVLLHSMTGGAIGTWLLLLILFFVDWFYHVAWEVAGGGQSPGKRLMGIRVVQNDGFPIPLSASIMRNLLRFADTYLFLYLIATLCISASPSFKRIGDWVAGSVVVWTSKARLAGKRTNYVFPDEILPAAPPHPLSVEEKKTFLQFARRYHLLGKSRADEIARLWTDKNVDPLVQSDPDFSPSAYMLRVARFYRGGVAAGDRA